MVGEELINAVPVIEQPVEDLIKTVKLVGGIFGIWLIFWIINVLLNVKRSRLLKQMLVKLEDTNKKLDKLVKKK